MTAAGLSVIDASVAVKWVLSETAEDKATALLQSFADGAIELIAPEVLLHEVASTLSKRCRRKDLTSKQAERAFELFLEKTPVLLDQPIAEALALALRHQISFWDSLYLALAINQRADLITADQRLYRSVSRHYPFVKLLS